MRRMSRTCAVIALGTLVVVAAAGCAKAGRGSAHSPVILISVDTLRADHLPAYGYRQVETPALDSLARDSIRYENAYSAVPLTLPSHAVILTGLLPYQNGVRDNIGFKLAAQTPTLASLWKGAGYATGAAVSTLALRADRGLASGFEFYDDHFSAESPDERAGSETVDRLTKWMETVTDRPMLVLLHLYEPHAPYAPPEPFRTRYATRLYDGEIAAADAAVGRFLEYLKRRALYDRAVVVFLSDHGEGLGDHGEQEHGVFLYREAIRVPLFLKLPGGKSAGQVVSRPVGLVDLLPTLGRLTGIPAPPGVSGMDLLSAPQNDPASRRLYGETLYPRLALGWSDLASLTDGRYEYIEAPRPELYDLVEDPQQHRDLAAGVPAALRSMRAQLAALIRPEALPKTSASELQKLGSLGYISVSRGESGTLPDPKDKVAALASYKRLFDLYYAKRDREAIKAAEEILREDAGMASVWRILAKSRERLGDRAGAARALEQGIAKSKTASSEELSQTYEQLAGVLEKSGDLAGAEKVLKEAIARNLATDAMRLELARLLSQAGRASEALTLLPGSTSEDDAASLDLRGVVLAEAGKTDQARLAFERALAVQPRNPSVLQHMGTLCLREKDARAARGWFEKALTIEPRSASALTGLGLAQAALGDEAGAYESWSRALAADPRQYDALYNHAISAGRLGRREEARRELERFVKEAPAGPYGEKIAQARRLLQAMQSGS
jgi:choline-sulfatase